MYIVYSMWIARQCGLALLHPSTKMSDRAPLYCLVYCSVGSRAIRKPMQSCREISKFLKEAYVVTHGIYKES